MNGKPPPDRYIVTPYQPADGSLRFCLNRTTFVWWAEKQTWFERIAEQVVGGVTYATSDEAIAERDRLNGVIQ